MEYIDNIVGSSLIQFIVIIITLLAFVITVLSYIKIRKVKEAQILYQNYLNLDNLINTLEIAKQFMESKYINKTDMSLKNEEIIESINKQIATIESVNKVLFNKNKLRYKSNVTFHANGYYNDEFFRNIILKARKRIIIYGKRNTRVFKQENILKLFDLARKNLCNIELMFFSPNISDDLLEEIRKSVPYPPKTIEEMRKTQIEYKKEYLEQKKKQNCDNIKYYESLDFPLFHFVVVDNKLYLGIVNYNKETEENSVYDDRPYLEFNVLDKFARDILNKYSKLVKKSEDSKDCY